MARRRDLGSWILRMMFRKPGRQASSVQESAWWFTPVHPYGCWMLLVNSMKNTAQVNQPTKFVKWENQKSLKPPASMGRMMELHHSHGHGNPGRTALRWRSEAAADAPPPSVRKSIKVFRPDGESSGKTVV